MILTIDSSVYLSAFLKNEPFCQASRDFLNQVEQQKIDVLLPILVPMEVANNLYRHGLAAKKAKRVFDGFFNTKGTRILSLEWALGEAFLKDIHHFHLKTADWIIAATCFYLKTQLASWDKALLHQTKKILKGKLPTEIF